MYYLVYLDLLLCLLNKNVKYYIYLSLCVCVCVCVCVSVSVCVCVHVYVVYEDTNLYNDMGMTGITRRR